MTDLQIKYWGLKEDQRHNIASEVETNRHNVVGEKQQDKVIGETYRHNVATEREANRANRAKELETHRHNYASELVERGKLSETSRHNIVMEGLEGRKVSASEMQAQAALRQARTAESRAVYDNALTQQKIHTERETAVSKGLDNDVRAASIDSEIWANKAKNYISPVTDIIDSLAEVTNVGVKAADVATKRKSSRKKKK